MSPRKLYGEKPHTSFENPELDKPPKPGHVKGPGRGHEMGESPEDTAHQPGIPPAILKRIAQQLGITEQAVALMGVLPVIVLATAESESLSEDPTLNGPVYDIVTVDLTVAHDRTNKVVDVGRVVRSVVVDDITSGAAALLHFGSKAGITLRSKGDGLDCEGMPEENGIFVENIAQVASTLRLLVAFGETWRTGA